MGCPVRLVYQLTSTLVQCPWKAVGKRGGGHAAFRVGALRLALWTQPGIDAKEDPAAGQSLQGGLNARSAARASLRLGSNCPVPPLKKLHLARPPLVSPETLARGSPWPGDPGETAAAAGGSAPPHRRTRSRRACSSAEAAPLRPAEHAGGDGAAPVSGHAALAPAVPPAAEGRGAGAWHRWPADTLNLSRASPRPRRAAENHAILDADHQPALGGPKRTESQFVRRDDGLMPVL